MASARPKVAYVLPVYSPAVASHLGHLYKLVQLTSGFLDVFVVIERAVARPTELGAPYYRQRFSWLPILRAAELFIVLVTLRARGYRNFYVHYSFVGGLAAWLVAAIGGGHVFYWNSGMPWLYRRPWLEETVFRFILRHTILVTAPPGLGEEYRRRYGLAASCIRIVPHFITVSWFQPDISVEEAKRRRGIRPEQRVILFVHRLSRRKGIHLIPDIAAEVLKRRKDVIFVVVGDGPERKNLESRIQNLGLTSFVKLVGEMPQRDLPPYFWAADVFLLPSEEEGFPRVLLEAMAAGVPYVATDVGGVRAVTPPELQGYLAPSGGAAGLAQNVLLLLSLPDARRAVIKTAEQAWVKRFDTAVVLPVFDALFR